MDFKRAQLLQGERPFSFPNSVMLWGFAASSNHILPHAPQVERGGLFSRVYFATDICDKQALDFMSLKNRRKTYPLRNELQKNRRQFGGLYRFVYCPHAIF
jgi:hypothetical protein